MPEEAGIPETDPSICPFCKKTECAHLMVKLNSNTRSVSSGTLLEDAEKKLKELRAIGMDYRQAFLELKERLFRVWGKVDDRRVTNGGNIEYWFWAQQEYHVRRQFVQYEMPQTCSRGDFIVAPVDGNAFNVARPDRDAGVISEKEQEAGRLARLEFEAQEKGYPRWALKFYSSGTLGSFCEYALGKGCEPKLRGSGINADFSSLLKKSSTLLHLHKAGLVSSDEVRNYFFPDEGEEPFDDDIIQRNKPPASPGTVTNHGPYLPPGYPAD